VDLAVDPRNTLLRPTIEVFVLVAVRLYRDGIVDALRRDPRFRVVGSAASLRTAREELEGLLSAPHVALLDLDLPDGYGAARGIREAWPTIAIVALAVREADEDVVSWAEAGVSGLVSRNASLAELLNAIDAAVDHELICSPAVAGALLRRVAALSSELPLHEGPPLTRRERQIVRLIGDGLSNKEIAGALQIELATVKNHVHNILEKLSVGNRTEAVTVARARGDLDAI
jgi:two-component system, NarL family, nitrate/nitrite response regulator NarL